MRYREADKYSVAWFKLAELVSRGEKERALGVYRLLSHSIEDEALVCQLEADLLWSFEDKNASERYQAAARLYCKTNRLLQAAAVYEHLHAIKPNIEYLDQLCLLYKQLGNSAKLAQTIQKQAAFFLEKKEFEKAMSCFEQVVQYAHEKEEVIPLYVSLFLMCINTDEVMVYEQVINHFYPLLDLLALICTDKELHQFLVKLEGSHKQLHEQALAYLHKNEQL